MYEASKLEELDDILFFLADGNLSRLNTVRRIKAEDAYKFIYQKRLETFNTKIAKLKELEYARRK